MQECGRGKLNANMAASKKTVEEILLAFGETMKGQDISTPDDKIDFAKLEANTVFQAQVTTLKALGVDGEWLRKNGFFVAHMLLASYLKK